jgi:hypothetical protein
VPLLGAGAPLDPSCDTDEDVMDPFMGSSPPCPHDLWIVLDLDGDGQNGRGKSAWKSYDRFTLRVSWPASVSPPSTHTHYKPHHYAFTKLIF